MGQKLLCHQPAVLSLVILLWLSGTQAETAVPAIPAPPQVSAKAWCVAEHDSGRILGQVGGNRLLHPSGLAKLMTLYLVFDALDDGKLALDSYLPVTEQAWNIPGSRMYLRLNSMVAVNDLILGLIIYNANDATYVLASALAENVVAFVDKMNHEAHLMGMIDTHYTHPAGLHDEVSTTTACEQLRLIHYLRKNHAKFLHYFAQRYHIFEGSTRNNPNALLHTTPGVAGLLSVQTQEKFFHATIIATRDQMALNHTLMGAGSRSSSLAMSASLLNHYYHYFVRIDLFKSREKLRTISVWHGVENDVALGALQSISVIAPFNLEGEVDVYISTQESVEAPVRQGQKLGNIRVVLQSEELALQPLVALQDVEQTHWLGRIFNRIVYFFE